MTEVIQYDPSAEPYNQASNLIVCVRYSDESNSFAAWYRNPPGNHDNGRTSVHDIDMGYADLDDPDEFVEWANSHTEQAALMAQHNWLDAAAYVEDLIAQTGRDRGHEA